MAAVPNISMVIGGAASGKSDLAEQFVIATGLPRSYIATAQAFDDEMRAKIARHQQTRSGLGWHTVEEPLDLPKALAAQAPDTAILLDCATLWLSNLLLAEADIAAASDAFFTQLDRHIAPVVIVTNEVGHGVVPDNRLSRSFVEIQGRFNQRLARHAGLVVQVTAGLPLALKGQLPEANP